MFARDGELVPVTLLKSERQRGGRPRAASRKTAQAVRHMLHLVTLAAAAPRRKAQTMGYSVGGKTGTAHKQEGKGYADKKYRGFFVGMAPVDKPRIVVAVMIDEPSGGKYFGGDVAAPVFSATVQQTPAHAGRAARHERQAADRGASGGGVVLMLELHSPQEAAAVAARAASPARCIATAARSGAGDGFIAWPGAATDGRKHVPAALAQGADGLPGGARGRGGVRLRRRRPSPAYPQAQGGHRPDRRRLLRRSRREQLDVLAVTGTNGKTSTAWWLAQALSNLEPAAVPCGLIGTLGIGRPPHVEFTGLTTPDPVLLQRQFRRFVDEGVKACAIEASSVGIVERRLDGTRIRVAVFTNFTQDHLDYHGTMEAYWQAKAELFRWPGLRAAVINLDDEKGRRACAARCKAARSTCGPSPACEPARLQAPRHRLRRPGPALRGRRRAASGTRWPPA